MNITKQKKLHLYTYALLCCLSNVESALNHEEKGGIHSGLCLILGEHFPEEFHDLMFFINTLFPELQAQKPKNVNERGYWWSRDLQGFRQRVMAVERAIQLTEKLPDHESPDQ